MAAQRIEHAFQVSALTVAHLDDLVDLERECYTLPWSRAMFAGELSREEGVRLGAWLGGALVGYLVVARYADVWHVMNIAVAPSTRRMGVAGLLLDELFERTVDDDRRGYTLEVRVSNSVAIALYGSYGFSAHGLRPGYYVDNREDAIVMWKPPLGTADDGWVPET